MPDPIEEITEPPEDWVAENRADYVPGHVQEDRLHPDHEMKSSIYHAIRALLIAQYPDAARKDVAAALADLETDLPDIHAAMEAAA